MKNVISRSLTRSSWRTFDSLILFDSFHTMKAVIADAVGEVSVHEIPKPVLKDSEILVEVRFSFFPLLRMKVLTKNVIGEGSCYKPQWCILVTTVVTEFRC